MKKSKTIKIAIIMTICGLFLFIKYIAQLFPSLIGTGLMQHDGLTALDLGILASSYYYSYSLMQIVSGWLLDRFNLRWIATFAIGILAASLFLFAEYHTFLSMCLSRIVMGVGASFATVLYLKCASVWTPPKTFGIAVSFLATATMLGAAFGGAPLAYLFHAYTWQHGLIIIGVISLILALMSAILISDVRTQTHAGQSSHTIPFRDLKSIFINKQNILLMLYSGLAFAPVVIMGGLWGTPFLVLKYHLSTEAISYLLSIMFLGFAIGAPICSAFSIYFQNRYGIMQGSNMLSLLIICAIIYGSFSYTSEAILFFILGFSVSCFIFSFSICKEINPVALLGFAFAFMNTGEGLIGSIVEPAIGGVLDITKGHHAAFTLTDFHESLILLPLCFIFAALILVLLKRSESKY